MMKRKTISEINRYEAPLCKTCLVAIESKVLNGSNGFSVTTESFDNPVNDDDNWM